MIFPAENLAAVRIIESGFKYAERIRQYPEHQKMFGDRPLKIKAKSLVMADKLLSEFDSESPEFRRYIPV